MAFREKSAWVSLVVTLVVYGVYFYAFGTALSAGRPFGLAGPLILAVIAIIVLEVVLTVPVAILSPREATSPEDEREREIQRRANAGAFFVLQVAVMCAIVTAYFSSAISVANAALAALAIGQLAKYGLIIVGYRRL